LVISVPMRHRNPAAARASSPPPGTDLCVPGLSIMKRSSSRNFMARPAWSWASLRLPASVDQWATAHQPIIRLMSWSMLMSASPGLPLLSDSTVLTPCQGVVTASRRKKPVVEVL
jgi:hypothetical protein